MMRSILAAAPAAVVVMALAGCGGGPTQAPSSGFTGSSDCKSTKAELNTLVNQGVIGEIEAEANGRKLSGAALARVDRYNDLLNSYLGSRCHL